MDLPEFAEQLWLRLRFKEHKVTWDFGFMKSCILLKAPQFPLLVQEIMETKLALLSSKDVFQNPECFRFLEMWSYRFFQLL
jgi:hypothetical protein